MFEIIIEKIKHVTIPFAVIFGFIGANIYVCRAENNYSMGQKIIIVLNGLVLSYMSGLIAEYYKLDEAFIAVIGYGSGMFGYSVIKYAIENEKSWMGYLALKSAGIIDFFLDKFKSKS